MPTKPPYPREARIETVEKGATDKTVTCICCGPITPNRIH